VHADDELVNSAAAAAVMIAHDELVEKYTVRTSTRTSYLSLKTKRGKEEDCEQRYWMRCRYLCDECEYPSRMMGSICR